MKKLFIECIKDMHKGVVFGAVMASVVIVSVSEKITEIVTGKH